MTETLFFIIFIIFITLMLVLDLGVFHKENRVVSFKEATIWTSIWIGVSLLFFVFMLFHAELVHGIDDMAGLQHYKERYGAELTVDNNLSYQENLHVFRKTISLQFLTGYLIEKALSLDNIFVMLLIFLSFQVDPKYYHRVLFYGILGAIVLRFIFIFLSAALISHFHWILLVFGLFLLYSGIKLFVERNKKETIDVDKHPIVKFLSKRNLVTKEYHGKYFFVKNDKKRWVLTPLMVVLITVELSDVIFAVDSIPAIFSVTSDPFIVFFSNIFAILGLRSLFFVLQNAVDKFVYLRPGLSLLLIFIGVKMVLPFISPYHIPTVASLIVIIGILFVCIVASIFFPKKEIGNA
ncbi:TerC/Alx family metal homeostasis membrane protein [Bacteroidales bacterium OttesenSCG-928-B11]|nr:TerC/Alx family metal homeostasis membrane protein [Bacteroidales bacterium OttesenSCG-928-C03]MDL2312381.1 TerC/Alx family metal homeostasis membrane protein [Bacteroidales bacterium OttesenSCG-928-B11]MDL2326637.1 TerC/Alx family metal homeostasis membrane protein [Bacteroidales bacterium OttesenSCG-928-A14]